MHFKSDPLSNLSILILLLIKILRKNNCIQKKILNLLTVFVATIYNFISE